MDKPRDVVDRVHEWADLSSFVEDPAPGVRIALVRGRRRHGKSFLLEHLCGVTGGVYTLALRQSRTMALARFSDSVGEALGRVGQFHDWVAALDVTVDAGTRRAGRNTPVLVVDELPYLIAHSPELPSALQALYDRRGPSTGHPAFRLILCGSAVSVMSTLLAGDQALRGRATLDIRIGPFGFRDAGGYWGAKPREAFLIDAILGGAPGYRDIVGSPPDPGPGGLVEWLSRTVLNPSHALFSESDYLLAEDPRLGDRTIYHSIWEAVARGAATPTQIGGLVGMDVKALGYHLTVMRDGGFIRYDQDVLWHRKPIITVADPVVRFSHLIVRPNLIDLEARRPRDVWDRSRETFDSKILGPHFEHLAREWVTWHGRAAGLDDIGHVGQTVVPCREHGNHEVDAVALGRGSPPRVRGGRITLLGEAKSTRVRPAANLDRLTHIRDLLSGLGWDTTGARLVIFGRAGFTSQPKDALLVDLDMMYRS